MELYFFQNKEQTLSMTILQSQTKLLLFVSSVLLPFLTSNDMLKFIDIFSETKT